MKFWRISILLAILLMLGLLGFCAWLLYSPVGSEWLLSRAVKAQGGSIGRIEGILAGQLQLSDLVIAGPDRKISCADLQLRNRLRSIVPLRLEIELLRVETLQIETEPSKQPRTELVLNWPELPFWLGLIEIDIQRLELVELRLNRQKDEQFHAERIESQIQWRDQSLHLTKIMLQSPELIVEGQLKVQLSPPSLTSKLQIQQRKPGPPGHRLNLDVNLYSTDKLLLFGPVLFSLSDSRKTLFNIDGTLGLARKELQFQRLRLVRPERSGTLTASGSLRFSDPAIGLSSHLQLSELDLQPETGQPIRLSGELDVAGNPDSYNGNFKLAGRAEKPFDGRLAGTFSGNRSALQLSNLQGNWLNGTLSGQAQIDWSQGVQATTQLVAHQLDPQLLHEQLVGELNLDLQAELTSKNGEQTGQLTLRLEDSTLHGQPLSGDADLILDNRQLEIKRLQLLGNSLSLQAAGKIDEQIKISWRIERLEQLFEDCRGQLIGSGRMSLQPTGLNAEFSTQGERLAYKNWQLAHGQLQGQNLEDQHHWRLRFNGRQLTGSQPALKLDSLRLELTGALPRHQVSVTLGQADANLQASFTGGFEGQRWQGDLTQLAGEDKQLGRWQTRDPVPLVLSAEQIQLGRLELTSNGHGELLLQGSFLPPNRHAEGRFEWQDLDLALLRPWLDGWDVEGHSSGSIIMQKAQQQNLHANLSLQGQIRNEHFTLTLKQGEWQTAWDQQGLSSVLNLQFDDSSHLKVQLSSPDKMIFDWPRQGGLQLSGQNFPLSLLQPWLPPAFNLAGKLNMQSSGQWQADSPWTMTGTANVTEGRFFQRQDEDIISTRLSLATLNWDWQEQLSGTLKLHLLDHGTIDASAKLPIKAAWPVQLDSGQSIRGNLNVRLQELGLLSIIFPGRIQESRGHLKLDLQLAGNWEQPTLQGDAHLFDAGVFLPTLGIQLDDIDLLSRFDQNRIEIKNFSLVSADGSLLGQGQIILLNWKPKNYQLQFKGERFQLVNLPELQIRVTPDLTLDGNMSGYRLRGTLTVPELLASSRKKTALAENSPDLVVVDATTPPEKRFSLTHDIDLQLLLGDQVLINSAGIDAKLDGRLRLKSIARQDLAAYGEIHVVKGKYASYGVSLDIARGNLLFNGGPLDQPSLDILALRKSGEVQAGVIVTGTPKQPVVRLYSEPVMSETDILSYIVLGRPIGAGGSQSGLLMSAAGALLSQGESVALQEKLKNRLGLDVLDINAGDGDVSASVITTGKYLNPDLYVSLGYSLFSNSNEMKVRYNLTPKWELESNIGAESGVDLFYKIDIP